jgi:dolichyl-phosphate beta-glucosyltransferase
MQMNETNSESQIHLSVILPAYNEENRLGLALNELAVFLGNQAYSSEVLVVDNGSTDRTLEVARTHVNRSLQLRILHEERAGKGLAVRRGMLEAQGEYRFMCDVDLSMPPKEIPKFLPPNLVDVDVAIGSREALGAVVVSPRYRRVLGHIFNALVRLAVGIEVLDAQCGFKCFRKDVAKKVFSQLKVDGFAFDVEALCIAQHLGYRVREVPIEWHHDDDSRVNVFRDSFAMAKDLVVIRRRLRKGIYDQSP